MGKPDNLKESNKFALGIFSAAHCLLAAWFSIGHPSAIKDINTLLTGFQILKPLAPFFLLLVIPALNRMPNENFKAVIVFWHFTNPLPGCRAFSNFAKASHHIDPDRVRKALGTDFPNDPVKQNQAWRHLYNQVQDSPSIQDAHKDYLLYRDASWLTIPIALTCFAFLWKFHSLSVGWQYLAIAAASYLVVRIAAKCAGETFVKRVLAVAGDAQQLQSVNLLP